VPRDFVGNCQTPEVCHHSTESHQFCRGTPISSLGNFDRVNFRINPELTTVQSYVVVLELYGGSQQGHYHGIFLKIYRISLADAKGSVINRGPVYRRDK
jgi:hypothetical protein